MEGENVGKSRMLVAYKYMEGVNVAVYMEGDAVYMEGENGCI
jgi:hypothetical protein